MSNYSAATKAFETPEVLGCILSCLSVEEFVDVQAAHPQFVAVAQEYRNLRYRFYLEEDPALQQDPQVMPRCNPLFAKAMLAGGWHFDIANCDKSADRETAYIHCERMHDSERARQQQPPNIPPEMIFFQPAPKGFLYMLQDKGSYGRRQIWDTTEGKFVVDCTGVGQNLRKNIDAVLGAKFVASTRGKKRQLGYLERSLAT